MANLSKIKQIANAYKPEIINKSVKVVTVNTGKVLLEDGQPVLLELELDINIAIEEIFFKYGIDIPGLFSKVADKYGLLDNKNQPGKKKLAEMEKELDKEATGAVDGIIKGLVGGGEATQALLQQTIYNYNYQKDILDAGIDISYVDKFQLMMDILSNKNGGNRFRTSTSDTQ